ncbi:MAG: hypothetical protein K9K63_09720 [Desulfotignum sp.]|nr:hypothetical protein [Desulfotignum sp.]MCF8089270.1 hypothetical protein [Desulfotignum sp.]MCF8137575.1 hypothetical protein [Desulfotignum sp.]
MMTGSGEIGRLRQIIGRLTSDDVHGALDLAGEQAGRVMLKILSVRL